MSPACAVIVMAKAPVAGYAKTRLTAALGAPGAARLAQRFLTHTLEQAVQARIGEVELCCAPDTAHPAFAALAQRWPIGLTDQGDGDLGARMARAIHRTLASGRRAVLIGTDAPRLDAHYLGLAARALDAVDVVLGPAADGGYALIGLRRWLPQLFADIPWSTERVLRVTRQRLTEAGWAHQELGELFDVDVPSDLVHVPAQWLCAGGVDP